jgi:ferredoxin like protein
LVTNRVLSLEDKIGLVTLKSYKDSHLTIHDPRICRDCEGRPCVTACPVDTYEWDEAQGRLIVSFENCFECGTCRLVCPYENIGWKYPPGGFGVEFRQG